MRIRLLSVLLALLAFVFSGHASAPTVQRSLQEARTSTAESAGVEAGGAGNETAAAQGEPAASADAVDGGEASGAEGGGEEGDEEDAKEGAEEEAAPTGEAVAGALMLMTCLATALGLLSLLHCQNVRIRATTWKLINAVMSVFVAVLYYATADVVLDHTMGPEEEKGSSRGPRVGVATGHFCFWVVMLVTINILMARCGRARSKSFIALNQVFSHICAFGAQGWINSLLHADPFDTNAGYGMLAVIFMVAVLVVLGCVAKPLMVQLIPADLGDLMRDAQTDLEIDVVSVATGFAIVQIFRFAVEGEVPTAELHDDSQKKFKQVESIGCAGFGILFAIVAQVIVKVQTRTGIKHLSVELAKLTAVLASAWFWIFWGDLQIIVIPESRFLGLTLMAVCYSAAAILGVLALEVVCMFKPSWTSAQEAVELTIIGFSWIGALPWEQVFDVASEDLAKSQETISEPIMKLIVSVIMAAIVSPPWFLYILPMTLKEEVEEEAEEKSEAAEQDAARGSETAGL